MIHAVVVPHALMSLHTPTLPHALVSFPHPDTASSPSFYPLLVTSRALLSIHALVSSTALQPTVGASSIFEQSSNLTSLTSLQVLLLEPHESVEGVGRSTRARIARARSRFDGLIVDDMNHCIIIGLIIGELMARITWHR